MARRLHEAGRCQRWRGTAEKPGEPPEVLRGCCQQHFVPDAAQAPQPETVEPENALHVRKSHLNLLALPAGLLEGFRVGQGADTISHIFVDVTGDFAHSRGRTLRLQQTGRAVLLVGPVVDDMTLVDVTGAGQLRATRADINIALLVEDKIGATEGTIGARRLVPHRYVRCDVAIHQPFEQPDRAIDRVAR